LLKDNWCLTTDKQLNCYAAFEKPATSSKIRLIATSAACPSVSLFFAAQNTMLVTDDGVEIQICSPPDR
jgi:hypothetical protein